MASSSVVKILCLVVLAMEVTSPVTQAAITCGQVSSAVAPCLNYLKVGGVVPAACCNNVRSLNSATKTTADRQAACKCLQSAASSIKGLNLNFASALPGKCGINVPYKISPSTNCNSVK